MYDPTKRELNAQPAKLPDKLEQPRVRDMCMGQVSLIDIEAIWVNENRDIYVNGDSAVKTPQTALPHEDYVSGIQFNQGLVLDATRTFSRIPLKLEITPLSELHERKGFDASLVVPVIWLVTNKEEFRELVDVYRMQTGEVLYFYPRQLRRANVMQRVKSTANDLTAKLPLKRS